MVKSNLCNLFGLTKAQQFENGFDPNDNGGYFIIHGSEWQITLQESVKYNDLRIMKCGAPKDKLVKKTQIKTMFISRFGDGYGLTFSIDIHMNENGEIYLGILDPFNQEGGNKLWFPFYVMMYMFDAKNDQEIANYILFNITDQNI
jgi:DNA-directed RNA polymerase beta subunit